LAQHVRTGLIHTQGVVASRIDAAELSRMLGDWADESDTLPDSLAQGLIELVKAGFVPAGSALPAQRDCATALGVSRGTVSAAYAVLEARGYLASTRGSGTRVRSGSNRASGLVEGRLFSFTRTSVDTIDLSTGALPASPITRRILQHSLADELGPYLDTDGYFPAGLPVLRQAIAEHLSRDGIPTQPQEILVTAGAQQATYLAVRSLVGAGDLALTEDPSYRGGLEALRTVGARIEAVPMATGGLDLGLLERALKRNPALLYCQTSIHNPTGQTMPSSARQELAELITRTGVATIEDCCSYDLSLNGSPAKTLARLVEPDLLIMVGTLSKLFWGGLRVGWIRTSAERLRRLLELRKVEDLATSVIDQLYAVQLLGESGLARRQRQQMLTEHLHTTEEAVREHFPDWTWAPIKGGSGLWVDTHGDALALAEAAKRVNVKLAAGPSFSPYDGQRSMLRLPVWHEPALLQRALELVGSRLPLRPPSSA
jgi:Transcriptional regulators containing a DNA-binding HTH domain and an aminotransferase domain (MocR family) and their eukaryotic orthologs